VQACGGVGGIQGKVHAAGTQDAENGRDMEGSQRQEDGHHGMGLVCRALHAFRHGERETVKVRIAQLTLTLAKRGAPWKARGNFGETLAQMGLGVFEQEAFGVSIG
jgi:hypothetical protein